MSIRIGILGYGNLAKGVELAIRQNPDMELAAVFTRRDPSSVKTLTEGVKVVPSFEAAEWKDKIDVLVICGGSATDLPTQTPESTALIHMLRFLGISKRSTRQLQLQTILPSSQVAGIPECSPSTVFTAVASFLKARIIHSGAKAYPRVTPMPSEEFRALKTENNTRFLSRALSRQSDPVQNPNSPHARSIRENASS